MSGGYQGGGMPDWRSGAAAAICILLGLMAVSAVLLALEWTGALDLLIR